MATMKKIRLSALIMILSFVISIQLNIVSAQNLLTQEWKFMQGDQSAYSEMEYDDSEWAVIKAGELWESQGYENYDGYGWYRKTIVIPSTMKQKVIENGGLLLKLGAIDDADETYFNGYKVGGEGTMPPMYKGAYSMPRRYTVPHNFIKYDTENVISVRVYDGGGGGGIYGGPIYCGLPGMEDLVQINMIELPEDRIFLTGGNHELTFEIENGMKNDLIGEMTIHIKSDFGGEVYKNMNSIVASSGGQGKTTFNVSALHPGFYNIDIQLSSNQGNVHNDYVIGVKPEQIVSPLDHPADFSQYWDSAKNELAAVAPGFKMIRQDSLCTDAREIFLVEMRSLGNALIRAWYSKPTAVGKHPAVLSVQGYGTSRIPENLYDDPDMAHLVLNIRGHGNSRDDVNPGFPGYILSGLHNPLKYIYRGSYMDCLRALEFLESRDEVDANRIGVEGGSQGGALSFATAALAPDRVIFCAPDVPFLSDFRDYFKIAPWPTGEFVNLLEAGKIDAETMYHTLSYIDIKNLAPWVKVPVFMQIGMKDKVCPPHINFAAYNMLNSQKHYAAHPDAGHGLPPEAYEAKKKWMRDILFFNR